MRAAVFGKATRTLAPAHGAQYTGTAHLIVTAFRDLGEVQLELNTRARVESIARGLSDDELRHLEAIASGKFGTVNNTVLERFMALNLIKHGPDGLGITLDGIRVVAVWHRAR